MRLNIPDELMDTTARAVLREELALDAVYTPPIIRNEAFIERCRETARRMHAKRWGTPGVRRT